MEYYCYISQSKVDQLLGSAGEQNPVEQEEDSTKTRDKRASGGLSKLLSLFSADLSYGRTDVLQTKVKLKTSYARKLRTLLKLLAPQIHELSTLTDLGDATGRMYLYRNEFSVSAVDSEQLMARLEAKEEVRRLVLHCSLKFFSADSVKSGQPFFHSTNYAFFKHRLPINFETVFIQLRQDRDTSFGSPLYLKLSSIPGVLI